MRRFTMILTILAAAMLLTSLLLDSKGFKVSGAASVKDYEAQGGKIVKTEPPPRQASPNSSSNKQ